MMDWARQVGDLFEQHLFNVPSTSDLFNMYVDRISGGRDVENGPSIRRQNLINYLEAYDERPSILLVIEAPGPWGCRFSGVPITSEEQLLDPAFPLHGQRSSASGAARSEYSANIFWRILEPAFPRFFIWNTVPFHPHHVERPDTIRGPRVSEIRRFASLNRNVIEVVKPREVLAVGRKAERLLRKELDVGCRYVRHPSQGGATEFRDGVQQLLI